MSGEVSSFRTGAFFGQTPINSGCNVDTSLFRRRPIETARIWNVEY